MHRWLSAAVAGVASAGALGFAQATQVNAPGQVARTVPIAQPVANSFIVGQVVDGSGDPVQSAVVTLSGGLQQISLMVSMAAEIEGGPRRALTDGSGRFVFSNLTAGSYTLEATKAGYLPGAFGRRRHGGGSQSLSLAEGERRTDVRIPMWAFVAINGTVLDEAGEPMVGVQVTAQRQGYIATRPRLSTPVTTAITDDRGVYRLDALPPGHYVVCVPTTQTYLPSGVLDLYQQARANALAGNAAPSTDLFRLLSNAEIRLSSNVAGGQHFGGVVLTPAARAPALPPAGGARQGAYQTRCYPDASPSDAERLTLESGAERSDINLLLRPVPTAMVSGVISAPDGLVANVGVRLLPSYVSSLASEVGHEVAVALSDAAGAFQMPAVPVGQYTLKVLRAPLDPGADNPSGAPAASTQATGSAELAIVVGDEGITDLVVPLRTGFRLTGRLHLDGVNPPGPALIEKFSIQLDPASGDGSRMPASFRGRIDRNGRITTNEIPPGRYVVLFLAFANDRLAMPGWEAVGATIDGRDASYTPFELNADVNTLVMTLSNNASAIAGTVRDSRGNADPGGAVLLFPTDRDLWRDRGFTTRAMRMLRASATGAYRLGSVPPGEYFVVALPDEEAGDWENPEVLIAASRAATRVTITKGEKKTVDLVTTPLSRFDR